MSEIGDETRSKTYQLCKEFMGDTWANLKYEDFHIEHISGGLSNLLYACSIQNDNIITKPNEPRKVLIRLYGMILRDNPETVVTDSVIFALLAEKNMGPKLHGVFTEGRVEEYIPSRHLYTAELSDHSISTVIARKMAKFHQLRMPLCKEPLWLFTTMQRYLDEAMNNVHVENCDPELTLRLEKIVSYDLETELKCLRKILACVDSPVVFCHNDLQEGNILIMDEGKNFKLMPIDFEYASYNYRGFDFGNHFCEWCYDYWVTEAPFYRSSIENYPNKQQQLNFIRAYLDEKGIPDGENPSEYEEKMVLEANAYALASHMLWALWSIVQFKISSITFDYMGYAMDRLDHYFYQKAKLPARLQISGEDL